MELSCHSTVLCTLTGYMVHKLVDIRVLSLVRLCVLVLRAGVCLRCRAHCAYLFVPEEKCWYWLPTEQIYFSSVSSRSIMERHGSISRTSYLYNAGGKKTCENAAGLLSAENFWRR